MGAHLDPIIDALEAMTITGYSMTVYRGATLKNAVEVADLPVRIISAIGMQSNRLQTRTLGGSGHLMQTEWTIVDVALLRGAGMGIGLKDIAPSMEGYMSAYHDALRTITNPSWTLVGASLRSQVQEWPQASGRFYDVVTATLTVSDIIQ
jgi:hypothetical protein